MNRLIFLFAFLSANLYAFSQDSTSNWDIHNIIYNLRKTTNSLNFQYNGDTTNVADSFSSNIFKLKTTLDKSYSKLLKVPDSDSLYRQSLLIDFKTIQNKNVSLEMVNDIIGDLNAKYNSFDLGLDQNGTQDIPVDVTTYDSALNKISGYFVCWNFWLDKDNPNHLTFHQFTNPSSSDFLPPGVYDIWVVKGEENKRYPSLIGRTKNLIFLKGSDTRIPVPIIVK